MEWGCLGRLQISCLQTPQVCLLQTTGFSSANSTGFSSADTAGLSSAQTANLTDKAQLCKRILWTREGSELEITAVAHQMEPIGILGTIPRMNTVAPETVSNTAVQTPPPRAGGQVTAVQQTPSK